MFDDLMSDPGLLDRELKSFTTILILATIQTVTTYIQKSSPGMVQLPSVIFPTHLLVVASCMSFAWWLFSTKWGIKLILVGCYLLLVQATNFLPAGFIASDPQLVHYAIPAILIGFTRFASSFLYLAIYFVGGLISTISEFFRT